MRMAATGVKAGGPAVVVVGSCNIDLIAYMERYPAPGETLFGTKFQQGFGGKGANQCVMAAKLSQSAAEVAMVGAVGADAFGRDYMAHMRELGVDTSRMRTVDGTSTGVAPIWVNASGENSIVVVPGANMCMNAEDAEAAAPLLTRARVLLTQLEVPLACTQAAMHAARQNGAVTILTPAPAPAEGLPDAVMADTSVLVPNRIEALMLTGMSAAEAEAGDISAIKDAAARLLGRGCGAVVVTMGADGSLVAVRGESKADFVHVPAVRVEKVVDTTGAGDAFSGALGYFYGCLAKARGIVATDVSKDLLLEAVRRAAVVAADSVTKPGTQSSYAQRSALPSELFASL